jgi:hypothetical protein
MLFERTCLRATHVLVPYTCMKVGYCHRLGSKPLVSRAEPSGPSHLTAYILYGLLTGCGHTAAYDAGNSKMIAQRTRTKIEQEREEGKDQAVGFSRTQNWMTLS